MGAADISFGDFVSVSVREEIGQRIIGSPEEPMSDQNPIQRFIDNKIPWLSGVAKFVFNAGRALRGFITNITNKLANLSLSEAWGFFQQAKEFVMNFNWQATDAELDAILKNGALSIASQVGEFFGCAIGYISCGLPMAAIVWRIDKIAAMRAIQAGSEEVIDELSGQLGVLMRQSLQLIFRWFFINKFKQVRKFIKWAASNEKVMKILPSSLTEKIKKWGEESGKSWTFAQARDNAIESIPNDFLKTGVEDFVEGFDECCTEIGYVLAQSFDAERASQRDQREQVLGVERYVELTPNREVPDERIVVAGRDELLRPVLMNLMGSHRLIENRDVGQYVGYPVRHNFQQADPSLVTLTITYTPFKEPPFSPQRANQQNIYWRMPSYDVPFVDPTKLDWSKIKRAAGGIEGYLYGKHSYRVWLGGRQMVVFAATEEEALTRLEALAELSTKEIQGDNFGKRGAKGKLGKASKNRSDPQRVYPAFCIIKVARLIQDRDEGRATLNGNFSEKRERIELWPSEEPLNVKEIFAFLKAFLQPETA